MNHVHTTLSDSNPRFGEAMTNSAMFYEGVFSAFRNVRTGSTVNKEIFERQELAEREFKKTYAKNPEAVVREAALCNTWRAEYGPRLSTVKDFADEAEVIRVVGEPPEAPTPEEVIRWRPIVTTAFTAWAALGNPTNSSVRMQIEDSMIKH